MTPGAWARSGMAATIVGLDWRAVDVLLPDGVDRGPVVTLLKSWEQGMLKGVRETAEKDRAR